MTWQEGGGETASDLLALLHRYLPAEVPTREGLGYSDVVVGDLGECERTLDPQTGVPLSIPRP